MIAENNEILTSATESLYKFNSDWIVREQCRAREDYERHERTMQLKLSQAEKALAEKDALIKSLQEQLAKKDAE
ncbi:MAG: hypothetical protein IJZ23_08825 [Roseburia sp.]|nr:hypothetical protein [Roseburia sp.]